MRDEKEIKNLETANLPGGEEKIDEFGEQVVDRIVSSEDIGDVPIVTLRLVIIGTGLAVFGGILSQIYHFRPQTVSVSALFLNVIAFFLGLLLSFIGEKLVGKSPQTRIGRLIYPGKFNIKEHVAIVILGNNFIILTPIAMTSSGSAKATDLIAASDLFYNQPFAPTAAVILVISSQLLGYGFAGLFRGTLVYPRKAFYPTTLASISLYNSLHLNGANNKRVKFFFIGLIAIFCWEWLPQYIAPSFIGISLFCLLNQEANAFTNLFGPASYNQKGYAMFTRVFGGSDNNEGLGFMSITLDWQYIQSGVMTLPWATLVNQYLGFAFCIILVPAFYVNNIWSAQSLPFMAQKLYFINETTGKSQPYDQLKILNNDFTLNEEKYAAYYQPFYSTSWVMRMMVTNLSVGAAVMHIILWYGKDVKNAILSMINKGEPEVNPHYVMMRRYKEVPFYWYLLVLGLSTGGALGVIYTGGGQLQWYTFIVAMIVCAFLVFFIGFMKAVTGFVISTMAVVQLVGGLTQPGNPMANMYFTLFGWTSAMQAISLLTDLKIGQYMKMPPKIMFAMQIIGTTIGAICNQLITFSVIAGHRTALIDANGDATYSGQAIQKFNSDAITYGALLSRLYSPSSVYFPIVLALPLGLLLPIPFYLLHKAFPKIGFNIINTSIICLLAGSLTVGVNSSILSRVIISFTFAYYVRTYHDHWFGKYNYIISAGLDAGCDIASFVISFAVKGAAGASVPFPMWALNPNPLGDPTGLHNDYCPRAPK